MEYEETYQGQRIVVTTKQGSGAVWTSSADLLDAGHRVSVAVLGDAYASEDEARRAAFSAAAAAIDRARASRGKP